MPNRAGLIPARKDYLDAMVAIAHDAGALVIFDEVISFRLGYSGASSFSRTFMRLMKIPPVVYRRQQAAQRTDSGSAGNNHSGRPGRFKQAE